MSVSALMEDVVTTARTYLVVTCALADKDTLWGQTMLPALTMMNACHLHVVNLVQISREVFPVGAAKAIS